MKSKTPLYNRVKLANTAVQMVDNTSCTDPAMLTKLEQVAAEAQRPRNRRLNRKLFRKITYRQYQENIVALSFTVLATDQRVQVMWSNDYCAWECHQRDEQTRRFVTDVTISSDQMLMWLQQIIS